MGPIPRENPPYPHQGLQTPFREGEEKQLSPGQLRSPPLQSTWRNHQQLQNQGQRESEAQGLSNVGSAPISPGQGSLGQGFPGQRPPGQRFPGQGSPGQGPPGQGYPGQGYPGQGYPGQGPPGQRYSDQGPPGQRYSDQGPPGQGP